MAVQVGQPGVLTAGESGKLRRRIPPVLVIVSLIVLILVVVAAITGDLLAPQDPSAQNPLDSSLPPGNGHLLGTDQLGRDVASLLVAGTRSALVGPLIVAIPDCVHRTGPGYVGWIPRWGRGLGDLANG